MKPGHGSKLDKSSLQFILYWAIQRIAPTGGNRRGDPLGRPKSVKIISSQMNHVETRKLSFLRRQESIPIFMRTSIFLER